MTALLFTSEANNPRRVGPGLPPLTSDEVAVVRAFQDLANARRERDFTDVKQQPRSDGQRLHIQARVTRAADALQRATARLARRQPGLIVAVRAALLANEEREYQALHDLVCLDPLPGERPARDAALDATLGHGASHDSGACADAHQAIRDLRRVVSREANRQLARTAARPSSTTRQ